MKKERLTELVASDPRLYSLYTTVRDTREIYYHSCCVMSNYLTSLSDFLTSI